MALSFFRRKDVLRYHYKKPRKYTMTYGKIYRCNHPVYNKCTLFLVGNKGLAVIQQRFDPVLKRTWWSNLDPWLPNELYLHPNFIAYFHKHSGHCIEGLYPTVTIRQIMWALKMKPIKKERWETVFDRREI